MESPSNTLQYATPATNRRMPSWMVIGAVLYHIGWLVAAIAIAIWSNPNGFSVAAVVAFSVIAIVMMVEWLTLQFRISWCAAASAVMSAVPTVLVPYSVIGLTLVTRSPGTLSDFERNAILAAITFLFAGAYTTTVHFVWWKKCSRP